MKLSPDSTFPLIVLLTWVELFNFITARPAKIPPGKIEVLHRDMRRLMAMLDGAKSNTHTLTSLPLVNYSAEDLKSLEASSTLAQLSSGLKSFKFHLDWIQQKEEVEDGTSKIKSLSGLMQHIIRQIGTTPEPVHPSLPPLKSYWDLKQAKLELLDKLFHFCNWFVRALGVLKHR